MKRNIIFLLTAIVLTALFISCGNQTDIVNDQVAQSAQITYRNFEAHLPYVTDFAEGIFVSSERKGNTNYSTFLIANDFRQNGLSGTVTVQSMAADCVIVDNGTRFSTYDVAYKVGASYLLLLQRNASVYSDEETLSLVTASLIIPAQGYEKAAMLFDTSLRDYIKTQEAMDAFDNGTFAEYILEKINDNPRVIGISYTDSTDIAETIGFSEHVLKVTVGRKIQDSENGDRTTYKCRIDEVLKGDLEPGAESWIVFPAGKAEKGGTYIVAVCEVDSPAFLVMASKSSVFDCSEYETLKRLINNE